MPSTNVAESADVTKNVQMSKMAIPESNGANGKCSNVKNRAVSTPYLYNNLMRIVLAVLGLCTFRVTKFDNEYKRFKFFDAYHFVP